MEEVSPSLKISLLIFALVLIGALGMMVVKSDELISGLDYSAASD